jgi:putative Holliday junction resolvase
VKELSSRVPLHGRVLALDIGRKRIGLAVSDELGLTAQGLPTLERTRIRQDMETLAGLARDKQVSLLLVGYPLHLSGDESRQSQLVKEFGDRLARHSGLPVVYHDERFTSVVANRVLRESGISQAKRGGAVDRLAAVILLESYLDRENWQA